MKTKKIIIVIFALILISQPIFSETTSTQTSNLDVETITEENTNTQIYPLWEDYCPPKYLNAKTVTLSEYRQLQKIKFLPAFPKQVENYNKAVEYWNERKLKFDKFINVCSSFPEYKQANCFKRISEREQQLNNELEKQHEKELKTGTKTTPASVYMDSTNPLRNMMMRGY